VEPAAVDGVEDPVANGGPGDTSGRAADEDEDDQSSLGDF
jgi:hypothetical protein